jgi:SAM-dependent methyltransferase
VLSLDKQEAYRRRYEEARPAWRPSTRVYEELVRDRLLGDSRGLDLGCGRGGVMERLRHAAALLAGADPDFSSLRSHRLTPGWLSCSRGEALPFPDDSFDLVCCSWVLEHLPAPAAAFLEVSRVLASGGHFVALTPNARHPLLWANRFLKWTRGSLVARLYGRLEPDTFPAYYRANTPARLERLARAAGMRRASLALVGDPSYVAFTDSLFRVACLLERLTPASLRIHLVADYVAPH